MEAAEAMDAGFFRGHSQAELCQPFGERPVEPCRFSSVLEGANEIIRKADDVCLPLTVPFDHPFEPMIHRVMEIDIRQYWREHAMDAKDNFRRTVRALISEEVSTNPGCLQMILENPLWNV
jgi:hypothetical protein